MGHSRWQGSKGDQFFRKGKAGAFVEEMPKDLITYFTEKSKEQLQQFGYETDLKKMGEFLKSIAWNFYFSTYFL